MKQRLLLFILLCLTTISWGQVTIASDGLNNSTTLFTLVGGAYHTGNSAATDRVASSPFAVEGTHARGVNNGTATLTATNNINTSGYTGVTMTLRVASFSTGSSGNGADGADYVDVAVSPDGGTNYYSTVRIWGNTNACWSYAGGTGNASEPYDGNITPFNATPGGGGTRTTDGYSTITITGMPATTTLKVRITMVNDAANERWLVDDFKITGTLAVTPAVALANNGTQVVAANVNRGTTNHILHKYQLGVTLANVTLSGMTCTTTGTYTASDISNLKVWYSADNAFNSGSDTLLSTLASPGIAGSKTFTPFISQVINSGATGYIFITTDISASATHNNTVGVNAIAFANLTMGTVTPSGTTTNGGAQTMKDVTAPTVSGAFSPADNATGVAINTNLVINFDENVQKGTGNITIRRTSDNVLIQTIAVTDASVTVSGTQVTINPPSDLANSTEYYILIDSGAITDTASNNFAGINVTTDWSFTTVAAVTLSVSSLTGFGNVCTNTTAGPNTFTITGSGLTAANVTVAALTGFTYSTDNVSYFASLSLTQPGGAYSQLIYVKFTPTLVQSYNGNIAVGGGGASSVNAAATGSGINTAATISTPTSTAVASTTSTLGGNLTSIGCSSATERGIYYSTTNGFADGAGTKVSTLGTFGIGVFTQAVIGLTANTVYYYKAFATNSAGSVYTTQGTFTTLKAEPSAHAGSFACGVTTTTDIPLTATAATGHDGYLIKYSTVGYGAITDPTDGTTPATVAGSTLNVAGTGALSTTVTGLTQGTTYYFKIYPYSNSGTNADYLTAATVPTTSCATQTGPCLTEEFNSGASAPVGWVFTTMAGTYTTASNYFPNSPSIRFDATNDRVETATLASGGVASELSFWIKGQGTNSVSALKVEGFTGSVWETIDNITNSIPTTGTTKTYNAGSSPAMNQTYVKFRFTYTQGAGNLSFDNVNVLCVGCVEPTNVTTIALGTTTATIGWTASTSAPSSGYQYEIRTSGGAGSGASGLFTSGSVAAGIVSVNLTSLVAGTIYYAYVRSNCGGTFSQWTAQYAFSPLKAEPTTHVTGFGCSTTGSSYIPLAWTTNSSGHSGYLIKYSTVSYAAITNPTDGADPALVASAFNVTDAAALGAQVSGLSSGTTYYFKIFPYSNYLTFADYKVDGSIPNTSCTTQTGPCISELFNDGTAPTPSGWTYTSMSEYTSAASYSSAPASLQFNATNDRVETTTVSVGQTASQLSFWLKGNGVSGSSLLVEGFDGSTWQTIENITTISNSGSNKLYNSDTTVPLAQDTFLKFRFTYTKSSGNLAFDDLEIYCSTACSKPSTIPSAASTLSSGPNTATIGWTNGNGDKVLVLLKQGSAITTDPSNGNTYTANASFGSGSSIAAGVFVVANGVVPGTTSVAITNLSPNTTYHAAIYAYNAADNCYNKTQLAYSFTTPTCTAPTISTIAPSTGPVNTEVTITATSGSLLNATAKFNGTAATVVSSNATTLVVKIASGSTTGNLVVTDAVNCPVTNAYTIIDLVDSTCQGGTRPTELFMSEITDESSGSLTYVELFNGTTNNIDLDGYSINIYNNGNSSPSCTIDLAGIIISANEKKVLSIGDNIDAGGVVPFQYYSSCAGVNNNDNIRLLKNGVEIDQWGYRTDTNLPGVGSRGYTFRRKNTGITAPKTPVFDVADWDVVDTDDSAPFGSVDYSDVGSFPDIVGDAPTISVHPSFTPSCNSNASLTSTHAEGYDGGDDTKQFNYKWFVCTPGAATWAQLTNTGVYTGATSATLSISSLAGLNGYQYYCQIRENDDLCYIATNTIKIDQDTKIWNGTVWSPVGAPNISSVVSIEGNYNTLLDGDLDAYCLTVKSGNTLTINADKYVNVDTDLTVENNAILEIKNHGSLVMIDDNGVITNNGTMTMERITRPYAKFDYTYFSSPMAQSTSNEIGDVFSTWRQDYTFKFDTSKFHDGPDADTYDDNLDDWVRIGQTEQMVPGKGYISMMPTGVSFATPPTAPFTFTGTFNSGIVTYAIEDSFDGDPLNDNDFNLVGNPYPSAIKASDFIAANPDIDGTVYIWTHKQAINKNFVGPFGLNFSSDDYSYINNLGGVGGADVGLPNPDGLIASGQAFFVESEVSNGNITFNNSMRNKSFSNSKFFRTFKPIGNIWNLNKGVEKSNYESKYDSIVEAPRNLDQGIHKIWLSIKNDIGMYSQQMIAYHPKTTLAFDKGYDAKLNQTNTYVQFYSLLDSLKMKIQARGAYNSIDTVPLGYSTVTKASYSIGLDLTEGIFKESSTAIYLEDKLLNVNHNLQNGSYSFESEVGTFDDRFVISFVKNTNRYNEMPQNNNVVIGTTESEIIAYSNSQTIKSIEVYDILGRVLYSNHDLASKSFTINSLVKNNQALIVKTVLSDNTLINKKIIF